MSDILPCAVTDVVARSPGLFPVVALTGARQTGKSTLVRQSDSFLARRHVTLDTAVNRGLTVKEPLTLLGSPGAAGLTIDDVQRVPDLLLTKPSTPRAAPWWKVI